MLIKNIYNKGNYFGEETSKWTKNKTSKLKNKLTNYKIISKTKEYIWCDFHTIFVSET